MEEKVRPKTTKILEIQEPTNPPTDWDYYQSDDGGITWEPMFPL